MPPDSDVVDNCRFRVQATTQPDIPAGHFRAVFSNLAVGVGAAQPFSNGDGLLGTIAPGEEILLDHLIMGCCDGLGRALDAYIAGDQALLGYLRSATAT